jgi:glycosyltransferase involved in cell wall biosynthesis
MKKLGILREGQRVAALMCSEILYFLKTSYYSRTTRFSLIAALSSYDALVCIGNMQASLARELTAGARRPPPIHSIIASPLSQRQKELATLTPNLEGRGVVSIANGAPGWRAYYKGIDLTIEAAAIAARSVPDLSLALVGEWPMDLLSQYARAFPSPESFASLGKLSDLTGILSRSALYLHLGRGDAFPASVLEAMAAGLPCIVSEWTGTREAVEQVHPRLVVPLDVRAAADSIEWYFGLPLEAKRSLSERSREIAKNYTLQKSIEVFGDAISEIFH